MRAVQSSREVPPPYCPFWYPSPRGLEHGRSFLSPVRSSCCPCPALPRDPRAPSGRPAAAVARRCRGCRLGDLAARTLMAVHLLPAPAARRGRGGVAGSFSRHFLEEAGCSRCSPRPDHHGGGRLEPWKVAATGPAGAGCGGAAGVQPRLGRAGFDLVVEPDGARLHLAAEPTVGAPPPAPAPASACTSPSSTHSTGLIQATLLPLSSPGTQRPPRGYALSRAALKSRQSCCSPDP